MIPYKQLSLADIFQDCQEKFENDKPAHTTLLLKPLVFFIYKTYFQLILVLRGIKPPKTTFWNLYNTEQILELASW